MFRITLENRNGLSLYQIKDTKTGAYVTILPGAGCALNNFIISREGKEIDIIDGYKDSTDLYENLYKAFKGHFLFPFPNRIFGGVYGFKGKQYQLKKNFVNEGNAIHGLLYDQPFDLWEYKESEEEGGISFTTKMDGRWEGFPFPCSVKIDFVFSGKKVQMFSEVINTGEEEMPATLGWHPYFSLGKNIAELVVEAPECEQWVPDTNTFSPVNFFSGTATFGDRFMDHSFRLNKSRNICFKDPQSKLRISIEPGKDLRYFHIYTPPHRNSIAIEPMSSVPDSFNNKIGFKSLSKNEKWTSGWSIEVLES